MAEKLRIAIVEDEQTAARDLENCLNSYARERGFPVPWSTSATENSFWSSTVPGTI